MHLPTSATICGVHSLGHDTGIAILRNNRMAFTVEAERLSRRRHESDVQQALRLAEKCVEHDTNVILAASTNISRTRLGIAALEEDCLSARIRESLFLETSAELGGRRHPCLVIAHEAAHAALACHFAGWRDNLLVLVNEGRGTFSRSSLFLWKGNTLRLLECDSLPWYGCGFGWTAMSSVFGLGDSPSVAGKLMALAGYADESKAEQEWLLTQIPDDLHFLPRVDQERYGERLRAACGDSFSRRAAFAHALQVLFTGAVVALLRERCSIYRPSGVALAGGCALNLKANTAVRQIIDPTVAIPPACNDSGQALGAALFASRCVMKETPEPFSVWSNGTAIKSQSAESEMRYRGIEPQLFNSAVIARVLARGGVVAFADVTSAIGPRSLGERSILANPSYRGIRERVSVVLKGREWYRPIAPAMRLENFIKDFPGEVPSPHMLFEYTSRKDYLSEATHVDGSSRIQTVDGSHPSQTFLELLDAFYAETGIPAVINTSLNRAGKAIAASEVDVLDDFDLRDVDAVVLADRMAVRAAV